MRAGHLSETSSGDHPARARPQDGRTCCDGARGLGQALDDGGVGLAAALAHRLQAVAAAGALELVQERRHQPGPGRPQRVAERDRAAVHVDLGQVGAGLLLPREHHRRERLVDLDEVDVVDRQAGLLQGVRRRGDRRREHVDRVGTAYREMVHAGAGSEVVLLERALADHEDRGRTVRDLRRDRRGDPAALAHGLERLHLLEAGVTPRTFVGGDAFVGGDLAVEAAFVDRLDRSPVRLEREGLHVLAGDAPLLGDELGTVELVDRLVAVARDPALRPAERVGLLQADGSGGAEGRADRDLAHVLHAAGDDDVLGAAHHALGCEVQRLLARPALAVDRRTGHLFGEARSQPRPGGDVACLRAGGFEAAEHDVFDDSRVDAAASDELLEHVCAQVGGVGGRQATVLLADGRADCFDDVGLRHWTRLAESDGSSETGRPHVDLTVEPSREAWRIEVRDWLRANVPAQPLPSLDTADGFAAHRDWERRLADARLAVVTWPQAYGGRGVDLIDWLVFEEEYWAAGAPARVSQNGIFLLAPTMFEFGSDEQKQRFLPPMARADEVWAQGWGERGAASALAALRSRADKVDGGWRVNGQKTWSSRAAFADWLFGLFRTDPESSRHRGLTYLLMPLDAEGVTVRPIRQLDGEPGFAEVFFDDVFVPDQHVLGGVGEGWKVAMSTTTSERGLTLRSPGRFMASADRLLAQVRRTPDADPVVVADAMQAWMDADAYRLYVQSTALEALSGRPIGAESSANKLFWSQLDVRIHETALRLLGPRATW